ACRNGARVADSVISGMDPAGLVARIRNWAAELGFAEAGISDTDLSEAAAGLREYLDAGHHGSMAWLEERERLRTRPEELHPGTLRVISLRMDYAPVDIGRAWDVLHDGTRGYISRYALGRDYH